MAAVQDTEEAERLSLEWMQRHAEALFLHDHQGRLTAINDVDRPAAPRLYLGRTDEGNIWRYRHDLPADLVAELEAALSDEPVVADLERFPGSIDRVYDLLSRDAPVERIWEGPAWRFPKTIDRSDGPQVQQVTADMEIVGDRFTWLVDEIDSWQPAFVIMDEGRIVSLCHSSRNTPFAAEAGVETLGTHRGRGYATAVVTAWAAAVRSQGREPLYSTSWDNHASRALARRLGLILIGADLHMT